MVGNITIHEDTISDDQLTVIRVFTLITSILGTVGNTLTIIAIVKIRFYKQPCYLFILNLNICNLIHCLIFHPIISVQTFNGLWNTASAGCIAFSYGIFVNLGTELWGYACITLNRYLCVVHYGLYKTFYAQRRYLVIQLIFAWTFYPVIFLLPLTGAWGKFIYAPQKLVCHPFPGTECSGFCLFVFVTALVTTVPLILYCYSVIIFTYIRSRRKVAHKFANRDVVRFKSTDEILSVIPKSDAERKKRRSELRMAFTILCVILVFGICRFPFMLLYLLDPSMSKVRPLVHTLLIYIGSSSNWINPVVYSLTNDQIRAAVIKLFSFNRTGVFKFDQRR